MTVRVALGASRSRSIRQLLTESLLLALVAGAVASVLAYVGLPAILALVPPGMIPDESEIALNPPVLIFTLGLSIVTSVVCGFAPALHSSRRDLAPSMREASSFCVGGSGQAFLRKTRRRGGCALARCSSRARACSFVRLSRCRRGSRCAPNDSDHAHAAGPVAIS